MMKTNPDKYAEDKISEFSNMQDLPSTLTITEIDKLYKDLFTLGTTDVELVQSYNRNGKNILEIGVDELVQELATAKIGIMYLIAYKNNRSNLEIEDTLLYYSMNAMRCTPINKYEEVLKKVTYPRLVQILTNQDIKYNIGTDKDELRFILNKLVDNIEMSKDQFDESKLDEQMDEFISDYVSNKIKNLVDENQLDSIISGITKSR